MFICCLPKTQSLNLYSFPEWWFSIDLVNIIHIYMLIFMLVDHMLVRKLMPLIYLTFQYILIIIKLMW